MQVLPQGLVGLSRLAELLSEEGVHLSQPDRPERVKRKRKAIRPPNLAEICALRKALFWMVNSPLLFLLKPDEGALQGVALLISDQTLQHIKTRNIMCLCAHVCQRGILGRTLGSGVCRIGIIGLRAPNSPVFDGVKPVFQHVFTQV